MIKCAVAVLIVFLWSRPEGIKGQECSCDSPNVRTAIYKPVDFSKECWTQEETAILFARMVMQELMPKDIPLDIPLLLRYFKLCLETVKAMSSTPKSHYIMVTAMSDIIGGYLRSFGLPTAKRGYYEGVVDYTDIKQLYELHDGILSLLGSDGSGWLHPFVIQRYGTISALPFVNQEKAACRCIVTYKCIDAVDEVKDCELNIELVPKPFLDNPTTPTAIAIPFSERSLFSLNSNTSTNILVDYFLTVTKCLKTLGNADCNPCLVAFNRQFEKWLHANVIPHVNDEAWYPGFGGVLRIIETLKLTGGSELEEETYIPKSKSCSASTWVYVTILLLVLIIFWLVVWIVYIFIRRRRCLKKYHAESVGHSSATGPILNTLVDLYCDSDISSGTLPYSVGQ